MLDANNAWKDLPTALRYMRIYERFDPYWIEEPFSPDDIDNHARLARRRRHRRDGRDRRLGVGVFKDLLSSRGAAAILQTDAAVCGGVPNGAASAATAASFGVDHVPTLVS